jgi:hypothetical protein
MLYYSTISTLLDISFILVFAVKRGKKVAILKDYSLFLSISIFCYVIYNDFNIFYLLIAEF